MRNFACAEALHTADCHCLVYIAKHFAHRAELLALLFLWANAAAYCGQKRGFTDDLKRALKIAFGSLCEEAWNVDRHGAALHARLGGALHTARSFRLCHFCCVAERHFVHIAGANFRLLLGHSLRRYGHSLFSGHFKSPCTNCKCARAQPSPEACRRSCGAS